MKILMIIIDLVLIIYGLFFIIGAKIISKMIEKSGQAKKDSKRINKLRIWGIVFLIVGVLILFWLLLS